MKQDGYRDRCLEHTTERCEICGSEEYIEVHHLDGNAGQKRINGGKPPTKPMSNTLPPEGQAALNALGDHPKTRLLLALLTDPDRDYNMTDIARLADTDRSTVYRHIDDLLEMGLVTKTRKAGNAQMYQINHESDAAEAFASFEWEVIKALADTE